jgi:hypothetical protein
MTAMAKLWNEQHDRRPALHRMAGKPCAEHPHAHPDKDDEQHDAHQGDQADRPYRQRVDAVDGKRDHFRKRVLCLAVQRGRWS